MIYAVIFYMFRTRFLKEICALSDRKISDPRKRTNFPRPRTLISLKVPKESDPKAHKFHLGNMCETDGKINA